MIEEISPVGSKKQKKRVDPYAFFYAPVEPRTIQYNSISLVADAYTKVSKASLDNTTRNRKDHEWTSVQDHKRRHHHHIQRKTEQKNFSFRTVDKIQ